MPQTEQLCPNGHESNANGNCTTDGCMYRIISHQCGHVHWRGNE